MKNYTNWILLFVFVCSTGFAQQATKIEGYVEPEHFERAERATWQKPDEVVAALHLNPGDDVADIGAGYGYFSRRIATYTQSDGIVFAVDLDPEMLRYIQRRAEKENQRNIITVLCPENDPMLAPNSVDLIFICDTLHHIDARSDYYKRLRRALRPGGRLAVIDYQKKEMLKGPPLSVRIAKEDLIQELRAAGFQLKEDLPFLPYQYFLIFQQSNR